MVDSATQPGYHEPMPRDTERSSIYAESGRLGFIYVLQSQFARTPPGSPFGADIPLLKIGATRKHPLQRAGELSAGTGVPEPMIIAYFRDFPDSFLAESLVHARFDAVRINPGREFFAAPLSEVVAFIDSLGTSVEYQDRLASQGVTGGEYSAVVDVSMPWADLFSTFEDRGDGVLNEAEQAACRELEAELS